ncbi:hypothetical protein Poly24_54530 [Rosistilla carotiformis]|uniref:Uncharacterized protein n=1 Tax=Rosistilla carotiformis TaxID=2528017 RepID=A0A518K1M2_9BACT|nr:hypothetical protein Poly24_54530 [Rosistilla carotiformis]
MRSDRVEDATHGFLRISVAEGWPARYSCCNKNAVRFPRQEILLAWIPDPVAACGIDSAASVSSEETQRITPHWLVLSHSPRVKLPFENRIGIKP